MQPVDAAPQRSLIEYPRDVLRVIVRLYHLHRSVVSIQGATMKTIRFLLVACFFSSNAFGRIGETKDECTVRYGGPPTGGIGNPCFKKNGMSFEIAFRGDKAVSMQIYSDSGEKLSDTVIEGLLKANSGGSEWKLGGGAEAEFKQWRTKDNKMIAWYMIKDYPILGKMPVLTIYTVAEFETRKKEKEAKESKKLEGL